MKKSGRELVFQAKAVLRGAYSYEHSSQESEWSQISNLMICLQVAEKQEQTNAKPGRDKKDLGRHQLNGDQRGSIKQRACFLKE